jgi:two-component system response regulator (stage 0 sporulation protein F)
VGKILVVDDQFDVRSLLVSIFRDDEYEVKMATDGFEALRLLKSFEPDLIFLDMKMPVMNGIETLKKIRVLDRRVAVIMMTGSEDDPQNMEQSKELGILCYIPKPIDVFEPFDLSELRERVKEILNSSGLIAK